jgi:hypothetical protein
MWYPSRPSLTADAAACRGVVELRCWAKTLVVRTLWNLQAPRKTGGVRTPPSARPRTAAYNHHWSTGSIVSTSAYELNQRLHGLLRPAWARTWSQA